MPHDMVILYILFCLGILKNGLSELLYIKNTQFSADMDDILNTARYKKFDRIVTSSSECAVLCSAYACDTFYYDVTSRNCRYVIFKTHSAALPNTPNGMENFIKAKSGCQSGWLQYGKYCISFNKRKATWMDAKRKGEEMGSKLVSLQSGDMHDFIIRRDFGHNAWVGARKTDVWRWEDNSDEIDLKSTGWAPGEPRIKDCMQIWRNYNYKWDDTSCDVKLYFICQATIQMKAL